MNILTNKNSVEFKNIFVCKAAPQHISSGKCKLKQQDITYLLKCFKSGTLTPSNDGEDAEQQKFLSIAGKNAKW